MSPLVLALFLAATLVFAWRAFPLTRRHPVGRVLFFGAFAGPTVRLELVQIGLVFLIGPAVICAAVVLAQLIGV